MKDYKIIIADLDGTLIKTISGRTFPKGVWDMQLRFDVLDKIKEMSPKYVLIVSNQGGIERGFVDEYNFKAKAEYIGRAIAEYCLCECYCEYCQYNDKSNPYRKPNTDGNNTICLNNFRYRNEVVIPAESFFDGYRTRNTHGDIYVEKFEIIEAFKRVADYLEPAAIKARKAKNN